MGIVTSPSVDQMMGGQTKGKEYFSSLKPTYAGLMPVSTLSIQPSWLQLAGMNEVLSPPGEPRQQCRTIGGCVTLSRICSKSGSCNTVHIS